MIGEDITNLAGEFCELKGELKPKTKFVLFQRTLKITE